MFRRYSTYTFYYGQAPVTMQALMTEYIRPWMIKAGNLTRAPGTLPDLERKKVETKSGGSPNSGHDNVVVPIHTGQNTKVSVRRKGY